MEQERKLPAVALEMLARRDRSEAELLRKLRSKGFSDEEINAVIFRLKELNYLDDRRLAERLASTAVAVGGRYGIRLTLDLAHRGIPRDIADEVLAEVTADHDERELVRDLLVRKFPNFNPDTADNRETARVMNYLLRRGFSRSAVFEVIRRLSADFAD